MNAINNDLTELICKLRATKEGFGPAVTGNSHDEMRQIHELRELGFDIQETTDGRVLLHAAPDALFPENIISYRKREFWDKPVVVLAKTASTQDLADRHIKSYQGDLQKLHGAIWVAETQTAGRGRFCRTWHSTSNLGCWFTLYLHGNPQMTSSVVSFAAGLAVRDAVSDLCGLNLDLKWPNDLICEGRKICGILTEASLLGPGYLVGIGINVHHGAQDWPPELRGHATSLAMSSNSPLPRVIRPALIAKISDNLLSEIQEPWEAIRQRWCAECSLFQKPVIHIDGDRISHGVLHDIDPDGAVVIRSEAGVLSRHLSGEIVAQ